MSDQVADRPPPPKTPEGKTEAPPPSRDQQAADAARERWQDDLNGNTGVVSDNTGVGVRGTDTDQGRLESGMQNPALMTPERRAELGIDETGKPLEPAVKDGKVQLDNKIPGYGDNGEEVDEFGAPLTCSDCGGEGEEGAATEGDEAGKKAKKDVKEGKIEGEGEGDNPDAGNPDKPKKEGDNPAADPDKKKTADAEPVYDKDGNEVMGDGTKAKVKAKATEVVTTSVDADPTAAPGAPGTPPAPTGGLNSGPPKLEGPTVARAAVPETDGPTPPTDAPTDKPSETTDAPPQTPAQQKLEELSKSIDSRYRNVGDPPKDDPNADQVARDKATFLARTDLTDQQKIDTLQRFQDTLDGKLDPNNKFRSNLDKDKDGKFQDKGEVRLAVAGGINDVAMPRAIDQGDNGTCNATTIQEGLAFSDPAKYAARLQEAALHGTYTGDDKFQAQIPSSMQTPHDSAKGAQNVDNVRNYSSQLMQGGMLNHLHQQGKGPEVLNPDGSVKYPAGTKQYYTDSDAGGEQRYLYNADALEPGGTGNPFRDNAGRPMAHVESGAGIGVNQMGFMGRNAGLQGQFVFAQRNFLDANELANLDPSVKLVGSAAELTAAKAERAAKYGKAGEHSIAVVNARNGLFTGSDGQGGSGGGHVVSTYYDASNPGKGDLSNQWGKQFDRKGVSDVALFNAMDYNNKSSAGDRGSAAEGKYDDKTLPQRFREHEQSTPNAHRDGVRRGDEPGPGDRRQEDKDKAKEKEEEKKKEQNQEGDGKKNRRADAGGVLTGLLAQVSTIKAHLASLQSAIDRGVEGTPALFADKNAQIAQLTQRIDDVRSA